MAMTHERKFSIHTFHHGLFDVIKNLKFDDDDEKNENFRIKFNDAFK